MTTQSKIGDQTFVTTTEVVDGIEHKSFMVMGLMVPNPREYYRRHMTYEQMRQEYELKHIAEVTEEDIMRAQLALARSTHAYSPISFGPYSLFCWIKNLFKDPS